MKTRKKYRHPLTAADFFAGIGGFRIGFEKAGYRIVYANDNDKYCCETYKTNFGEIDPRDIRSIDPESLPDFDVLLAGFPCQPFSMVGKRNGLEDDRGKLFFYIVKILNAKQPRAFVLENVKHLLYQKGGEIFKKIIKTLEWAGYRVFYQILNSQNFGVPQYRERLFIVGFENPVVQSEQFQFPIGKRSKTLKEILERRADENFTQFKRFKRKGKKGNRPIS